MIVPIEEVLLGRQSTPIVDCEIRPRTSPIDEVFTDDEKDVMSVAVTDYMLTHGIATHHEAIARMLGECWAFHRQIVPEIQELIRAIENRNPTTKTARAIIRVETFMEV